LNRRWRFCRLSGKTQVVDSSCFLVSAKPSFYPVFGGLWSPIGPKFVIVPVPVADESGPSKGQSPRSRLTTAAMVSSCPHYSCHVRRVTRQRTSHMRHRGCGERCEGHPHPRWNGIRPRFCQSRLLRLLEPPARERLYERRESGIRTFPASFRFCKLQIPHCHGCRECQPCRGALPAIAREFCRIRPRETT